MLLSSGKIGILKYLQIFLPQFQTFHQEGKDEVLHYQEGVLRVASLEVFVQSIHLLVMNIVPVLISTAPKNMDLYVEMTASLILMNAQCNITHVSNNVELQLLTEEDVVS